MQPYSQLYQEALDALEEQLKEYEMFLEESINNNEILAKTKIILREIKRISKKIIEIKNLNGLK
jgi:hypothetical protein